MRKTFGLLGLSIAALSFAGMAGSASAQAPSWNGQYEEPPRGSYMRSCREISAYNGQVWALCQTGRGSWNWSSARTRDCGGQGLENRDGRLQCVGWNGGGNNNGGWNNGNGGGGGGRPGGGSRDGVMLFEDPQYQGRSFEVNGDMPDLDAVKFNDKASSIQIGRAGGRWEICEHANYQGRCSRLDADQAVLPREWNDAISSIRRVR